jgi:hypothetical protein
VLITEQVDIRAGLGMVFGRQCVEGAPDVPSFLLRPLGRLAVPAMGAQALQEFRWQALAITDGNIARICLSLRIPGMVVLTVGLLKMKRSAISGMVMPSGTSGLSASACSTLASRFSGTK